MSWKSYLTAGLLCVLASPVFAQPELHVVNGPALDANGNWQWTVSIEPSETTVVAAELGFSANSDVVSATAGSEFSGANTENPGSFIFGWETAVVDTNEDEVPDVPAGIELGTGANTHQAFVALGSITSAGYSGSEEYVTIVTEGPTNTSLTGTLEVLGAYGDGGDEGRIAVEDGATDSLNYKGFFGDATRTLQNADINLSGVVDDGDFGIFGGNYEPGVGGKTGGWTIGDFNRDGFVDDGDFGIFGGSYDPEADPGGSISNLSVVGVADPPAGGGSGAVATPEPASAALVGLALLGGVGLFRRKR